MEVFALIIYRVDYFISLWARLFASVILLYIVIQSLKSYKNKPSKSKKFLFISFSFGFSGMVFSILIAAFNAFFEDIPIIPFRLVVTIFYITQLLAVVLSIHFTIRAFYETYRKTTLALFDILTGFLIGAIIIALFSEESWNLDGHPPEILTNIIILAILAISIKIYQYAKTSAQKQTKILLRKSMEIYSTGVLIFLIGMGSITIITLLIGGLNLPSTHPLLIILNNMIYLFNPINSYLMYVGCFQPNWFRDRYEDSWIGTKLINMGYIRD